MEGKIFAKVPLHYSGIAPL